MEKQDQGYCLQDRQVQVLFENTQVHTSSLLLALVLVLPY